ncbi:MAG: hypothetical protein IJ773_14685 [Lachnospiraceae bacterium]|nr:hypothetical protein [Lachnospiraceae bacterium]
MKKLLCVTLTALMLAATMIGCGSSSTPAGENESKAAENEAVSYEPVKITEKYSFEDPEGLDFDTRYVIYGGESSSIVASAANYGMSAIYSVLYGKDDMPVAQYDFMVVDTEEHAKGVIDLYTSIGQALTQVEADPTILTGSSDADKLEGAMVAYQSAGMISEATLSAYVSFYAQSMGGTVQ